MQRPASSGRFTIVMVRRLQVLATIFALVGVIAGVNVVVARVLAAPAVAPGLATPMSSAFTYQGQLKKNGAPVNDVCDFRFSLWDSPDTAARQVGRTQEVRGVVVKDGQFSVQLNGAGEFGPEGFTSEARWLRSEVTCRGDADAGVFTPLNPPQELTPAPFAIFAANAEHANSATKAETAGTAGFATEAGNAKTAGSATDFSGELEGDVIGTQKKSRVVGLRGKPISDAALTPTNGQVLKYVDQGGTGQWVPGGIDSFTGALAGDVTGTQGKTKVEQLQGVGISTTKPANGQVLKYLDQAGTSTGKWTPAPADVAESVANFTGTLAGDVTGTQGKTKVVGLLGYPASLAVPPADGQVLKFDATTQTWVPAADNQSSPAPAVSNANPGFKITTVDSLVLQPHFA